MHDFFFPLGCLGIIYIMGQIDLLSLEFYCVKSGLIRKNFVGLRGEIVEKSLIFLYFSHSSRKVIVDKVCFLSGFTSSSHQMFQNNFFFEVDILLKAVGDTPIMKTKKWAVERTRTIQGLIDFIKKFLKLVASEQLV